MVSAMIFCLGGLNPLCWAGCANSEEIQLSCDDQSKRVTEYNWETAPTMSADGWKEYVRLTTWKSKSPQNQLLCGVDVSRVGSLTSPSGKAVSQYRVSEYQVEALCDQVTASCNVGNLRVNYADKATLEYQFHDDFYSLRVRTQGNKPFTSWFEAKQKAE